MSGPVDLRPFARALAHELGEPLEAPLLEELAAEWRYRTDPDHCARYAARCPVPQADPEEYRLRRLRLEDGQEVLAGIHFKGLDLAWPFVGVRAWTAPDPPRLPWLARVLGAAFARFQPRAVQVFRRAGTPAGPAAAAELDQHLLVGRVAELRALPPPRGHERLQVRPASERQADELAAWVADRYRALHRARPELTGQVSPADAGDLAECARAEALFEVAVEGELAGLFAARRGTCLGHHGAEVVEEVLDPPWWGQGLGPALQRACLDRLPPGLGPWVWGTIAAPNLASLRTAQRAGRRVAGAWWFVPCP